MMSLHPVTIFHFIFSYLSMKKDEESVTLSTVPNFKASHAYRQLDGPHKINDET